jgi:hypothetical protein
MKQFFSLLLVSLLVISCGSKSSPTSSGGFTWNGPLILTGISNGSAFTEIATSTGPVINAAVTLTYSGTPAVLTYQTSASYPVTASGSVTLLSLAYYLNNSFTYTAGQPYTITAVFGGSTYSAYTTAVGNINFSAPSGSSMTCSWAGGGNENVVDVDESSPSSSVSVYGPNVSSPANITLLGTHGTVFALLDNLNSSAFSGTSNGSYLVTSASGSTSY